jgi:hypothetical protein
MVDSVHFARWLAIASQLPYDFYIFPTSPNRRVHSGIKCRIGDHQKGSVKLVFKSSLLSISFFMLNRITNNWFGAAIVALVSLSIRPIAIHAHQLQFSGYMARRAISILKVFNTSPPRLLATNWGSEITWYGHKRGHSKELRKLLASSHALFAECQRDIGLAQAMGYVGPSTKPLPIGGGFEFSDALKVEHVDRRWVLIKGYMGKWGLGDLALRSCVNVLQDMELENRYGIIVYSSPKKLSRLARQMSQSTGIEIKTYPKFHFSHDQMLGLMSQSRACLAISKADGISTTFIEALSAGCIPIQSNTSCANEWSGEFSEVRPVSIDTESIQSALKKALELTDYKFMRLSQELKQFAASALNADTVNTEILSEYEKVLCDILKR